MPASQLNDMGSQICQDVLIFQVAQFRCGIVCDNVREIVPMASTLQVPGQPLMLSGFLNLRGDVVPVVRLRQLFGLPAIAPGLYTPLIVVKAGEGSRALCVDRVIEVRQPDFSHTIPIPAEHLLNDCADVEFSEGENTFVLINPGRLLIAEEQKRVAELTGEMRRRQQEIEASRA